MSLDGRTATAGRRLALDLRRAQPRAGPRWRGECDAIAVGIGTVLADDPLLTARLGEARQPVRVVFDSAARLPLDSQLLATLDEAPLTVVHGPEAAPAGSRRCSRAGAETILAAGATPAERVAAALAELGRRDITSLLLEGGATLAAAFAAAGQIDEARVFVAPLLLGGPAPDRTRRGPPRAAATSRPSIVGEDTLVRTRFKEW